MNQKDLTAFVASLVGLASIFMAIMSPRRFYSVVLRRLASRKTKIYVKAAFLLGASLAASLLSALLSALAATLYILEQGPQGWLAAPLEAPMVAVKIAELSLAVPVLFALLDALAIYVTLLFLDRRGLLEVLLVRASSVIPYTLKAPLAIKQYGMDVEPFHIYAAAGHQIVFHVAGAALTAYGLARTLEVRAGAAVASSLAVLALHILAGLAGQP